MTSEGDVIRENDPVFIRLPSENVRFIHAKPNNTISLGKFGSFLTNSLIGQHYDEYFEIYEPRKIRVVQRFTNEELEDESKNNKELVDSGSNQKLQHEEIEKLKGNLKTGSLKDEKLIEQIAQSSTTFDKKTSFAQAKYLARKGEKYFQKFHALKPCMEVIARYMLERDPTKVLDLTPETIGLMLTLANVRPGGRYLVVDESGCLLLGSLMERVNRKCQVMLIHPNEQPNNSCLELWGSSFTEEALKKNESLRTLNWLHAVDPEEELREFEVADIDPEAFEALKPRHKKRYLHRKAFYAKLKSDMEDYAAGNYDALLYVSNYHPKTTLKYLLPKVGLSCPVIIYSPYQNTLVETSHALVSYTHPVSHSEVQEGTEKPVEVEAFDKLLGLDIHEARQLSYQVLPGRTHPLMTQRGDMGYILSAIKVRNFNNILAAGRFPKRSLRAKNSKSAKRTKTETPVQTPVTEPADTPMQEAAEACAK
ncbi:tRNA methyltransferase [Schizosaccharomyces japonicus yFS275]|uniref:tRNA (adenine(58)-N(1))-methyltransferase non-catalytic subunit TRM6 n=1 Tax=Schizosaccharomyces japonicus (strain yFS275 / FY16936) TaxID=402676 RepID=B6K0S4_SCHJY|nr:tRNA methyltransferase [Schizosaccharomyces japonicus yFS275]EEB07545.1 tRNA methyltransferase [Schizosaccharomyces japonicus yFS275]